MVSRGPLGSALFGLGLILVVAGGLLVATWDPEPRIITSPELLRIPQLELRGPGVVELESSRILGSSTTWGDPSSGPVVAVLDLPAPPSDCDRVERLVDYNVGGVVEAGEAPMSIRLEAVLPNDTRITLEEYTAYIPRLGGEYTTATPLGGDGGHGSVTLTDGGLRLDYYGSVKVPLDAVAARLILEIPLQGNVTVHLQAKDTCFRVYNVDTPFLAPAGYSDVWIKNPVGASIDTKQLNAGLALIAFGNALALAGLYLSIGRRA